MECPTCEKSLATRQGMRQHHAKVHGESLPNERAKTVTCRSTTRSPDVSSVTIAIRTPEQTTETGVVGEKPPTVIDAATSSSTIHRRNPESTVPVVSVVVKDWLSLGPPVLALVSNSNANTVVGCSTHFVRGSGVGQPDSVASAVTAGGRRRTTTVTNTTPGNLDVPSTLAAGSTLGDER